MRAFVDFRLIQLGTLLVIFSEQWFFFFFDQAKLIPGQLRGTCWSMSKSWHFSAWPLLVETWLLQVNISIGCPRGRSCMWWQLSLPTNHLPTTLDENLLFNWLQQDMFYYCCLQHWQNDISHASCIQFFKRLHLNNRHILHLSYTLSFPENNLLAMQLTMSSTTVLTIGDSAKLLEQFDMGLRLDGGGDVRLTACSF